RRHSYAARGDLLRVRRERQEDAVRPRARGAGRRGQRRGQRGAGLVDSDDRARVQGTSEVAESVSDNGLHHHVLEVPQQLLIGGTPMRSLKGVIVMRVWIRSLAAGLVILVISLPASA